MYVEFKIVCAVDAVVIVSRFLDSLGHLRNKQCVL